MFTRHFYLVLSIFLTCEINLSFGIEINGSNLIIRAESLWSHGSVQFITVHTDTGLTFNSTGTGVIEIPLSTCPSQLTYLIYVFIELPFQVTVDAPFEIRPEYIPNAQNLSLQLLPNSNNRIIRLNWTVDKNKEILCPYKMFAFFEDNGKRCEFPTEMNYYEFDTLDLNKMYKIGVVIKSLQNSSLRNEVYMDYSTYDSVLGILDGLRVKSIPKIPVHVISWNSPPMKFNKCLSHYVIDQSVERDGVILMETSNATWHLNNIIHYSYENANYSYRVHGVYQNGISTASSQWVSVLTPSARSKICPCEFQNDVDRRWEITISLVHKSVNPNLHKPQQYILRSLTEADMKNKTFQLFVRNRSVVMHEV
uniref:Fibronectin type-III domain-containing protein n=1 Tax=Trichobilharzia regenti TaxID=157069 RepID=A0AA85JIH2_TRIRE|nr:unnamed protein product [Trichobilharzia regenti]